MAKLHKVAYIYTVEDKIRASYGLVNTHNFTIQTNLNLHLRVPL